MASSAGIEGAIVAALQNDSALAALVSSYAALPSIFANEAPEDAKLPYITVRTTRNSDTEESVLQDFTIYVDYWDFNKSRAPANSASERIEFILDNSKLESERHSSIRVWFFSGGWVDDTDSRDVHFNVQFYARGVRKKWILSN